MKKPRQRTLVKTQGVPWGGRMTAWWHALGLLENCRDSQEVTPPATAGVGQPPLLAGQGWAWLEEESRHKTVLTASPRELWGPGINQSNNTGNAPLQARWSYVMNRLLLEVLGRPPATEIPLSPWLGCGGDSSRKGGKERPGW